jgi:Ca2+-binding RTX toxin-like protein
MATVTVGTDYVVNQGGTLNFSNETAFHIQSVSPAGNPSLTIAGAVRVTGTTDVAAITIGHSSFYNSKVEIQQSGVVRVQSTGGVATGYSSGSWSPEFSNHGVYEIFGHSGATGLRTWDAGPWRFENSGTYTVRSNGPSVGVSLVNGGDFVNSGTFTVSGDRSVAVSLQGFDSSFRNTGEIWSTNHSGFTTSIGVEFASTIYGAGFVNDGLIVAGRALVVRPYAGNQDKSFTNNGRMLGDVDLGPENGVLINAGYIRGAVNLGDGADRYDGARGEVAQGVVAGEAGNDTLVGGAGAETLSGGSGEDSIDGGAGDDVISGGAGDDVLQGGSGFDTLTFGDATTGVQVDLAAGIATASGRDTVSGFESVVGGVHADTLGGGSGADTLSGAIGDDQLSGGGGADWLEGGNGRDTIAGDLGDDTVFGGDGDDLIRSGDGRSYVRGENGNDTIIGGDNGFEDLHGNAGDDSLAGGGGDDWVVGGKDNDFLSGGRGADIVYGNLGHDTAYGEDGADLIRGGQFNDLLFGGAGDDWLSGDRDSDTISGGSGADIFHTFGDAGVDRVMDFNRAEGDRVQLDPGTTYSVAQVGADTVITMGGGAQMTLVGVSMATLTDGWIFTL